MAEPGPEPAVPPPQQPARRLKKIGLLLWAMVFAAAGLLLFLWINQPQASPETVTADYASSVGGPFELTAADGSVVTERDLAGKPFAIFFGFTRCPDVCPTTLARMAQLRKRMGEDGDTFAIVFVSVDPGYDTPEDIGRYVDLFDAPILGLTGTDEQIARIVKAYHVYYEKVPVEGGDYTIDHTAGVFLMDREGNLQSTIDHHEGPDASLAKLERLVA